MNNYTKPRKEEGKFQQFVPFSEHSSVMVSKHLLCDIQKNSNHCVHKYLQIDYFVDSILNKYFYLASPSTWEDPFETKYLDTLNSSQYHTKHLEQMKDMSIFCTCMTFNNLENEEASWKSYGDDKEQIIRISFNFEELCKILSCKKEELYVGKLDYKKREAIIQNEYVDDIKLGNDSDQMEVLFVNNFCLKQIAYNYENELRFCRIMRGDDFKQKKEYKIENVDLLSAIRQITLPPINKKKTDDLKTKEMEQIKKYLLLKALCPNISIHVSNLYNTDKAEMTSELDI